MKYQKILSKLKLQYAHFCVFRKKGFFHINSFLGHLQSLSLHCAMMISVRLAIIIILCVTKSNYTCHPLCIVLTTNNL